VSKTTIDWTDYSWNPITGCTPISPGCARCYAKSIATRFKDTKAFPNGFDVTLHPERLEQPLHWRKPRRVFLCSAGDLFHEDVPFEFIDRVFHTIEMCRPRGHILQILTKRPERLLRYYEKRNADFGPDILPHVWFGVTAENQEMADKRIPLLLQVPAAVRFVSVEPFLGPVRFADVPGLNIGYGPRLDWVIAGGETGPNARPMHPDWARSFRDQCQAAGVPFWFKQWGEWAPDCLCGNPVVCKSIPRPMPGKPGVMFRCGKRAAGHLLDGQEWRQFPG
jgi:protein gp37